MKFPPLLSKEEKEALLDKKIEEMRRKNAAKERRFRVCILWVVLLLLNL